MNFIIISPKTINELLKTVNSTANFRFGAGYTDLVPELKKADNKRLTVLNLAQIRDKHFHSIERIKQGLCIGALVTAHEIIVNKYIEKNLPVLHSAAGQLASTQIRHVATVGGNLCTASPAGDIACALMALKAQCGIMSADGKTRTVPVEKFFTGVRKTVLKKKEVLRDILIPLQPAKGGGNVFSGFIKIGTRRSMECSVVSLAYHIITNNNGVIVHAGIAIGSAAPVVRFVKEACDFLTGKNIYSLKKEDNHTFAAKVLDYASPISDIRASAWYRKEVLFNVCKGLLENFKSGK